MKTAVRRLCPIMIVLFSAAPIFAEPPEKPVGRSVDQRFGTLDPNLEFNPGQGTLGKSRVFATRDAQAPAFQYDDRVRVSKFETREFSQPKTSWLSKLKFWAKDAKTTGDHTVPGLDRVTETKSVTVKEARDQGKIATVRDLPDGDRVYLGPERAKLDRAVDPNKPLPGWAGEKMDPMTLGQVRELLNKNK
jgi:hypothetical protein